MQSEVEIIVSGIVQGVAYRYSAYNKAIGLGLKGSVKNLPNGNVLIIAQGGSLEIAEFIDWCKVGPPMAKVDEVIVTHRSLSNFSRFAINH